MNSNPQIKIAFCLGMHKSGTSWLHEQLYHHPEVHTLQRDSHFFSKDSEYNKGIEYFTDKCKANILNIEMGNHYATDPIALDRILQHFPNALFFIIVRDPIDRLISHHKQNIMTGTYRYDTSLQKAIGKYPNLITYSRLSSQCELLNTMIGQKNYLLLDFSIIKSNPSQLLSLLQQFLGVSSPFNSSNSTKIVNQSRVPKSKKVEQFQNAVFYKLQQTTLGNSIWSLLKRLNIGALVKKINTSSKDVIVSDSDIEEMKILLDDDLIAYESLVNQ